MDTVPHPHCRSRRREGTAYLSFPPLSIGTQCERQLLKLAPKRQSTGDWHCVLSQKGVACRRLVLACQQNQPSASPTLSLHPLRTPRNEFCSVLGDHPRAPTLLLSKPQQVRGLFEQADQDMDTPPPEGIQTHTIHRLPSRQGLPLAHSGPYSSQQAL